MLAQQTMFEMQKNAYPSDFESFWQAYPRRNGPDPKRAAYAQWQARLNQGAPAAEMIEAAKRYAAWCEATGKNGTEYIMRSTTFLGPRDYWMEEYELPKAPAPKTNDEWMAAGRELGLAPGVGESWPAFKDRVKARMGN